MLNDISERQTLPEYIDKIAASSQAYGIVKSIARLQSLLVISAAILGPSVAFAYPDAKGWAALYAVAVLLLDGVFIDPAIKRYQELGARIQEEFDTDLFRIPWNSHRCHSRPDPEVINHLAAKFKKKETTDRLMNWYPVSASELPIEYGRLVCQRANMRWDAALRRYYSVFFIVILVLMVIGAAALAMYLKWEASHIVISLVLPLLPAGLKLLRECQKHQDSATVSERTKSILESIWYRGLKETVPTELFLEESRRLQDELFDRRKCSPTVPQRLYLWLRDEYERDMQFGSEKMVKDAKAKLGIN
ncbi:MAG: S-4TM family putative pore-forming effector [Planctomycetota bacterium]